MLTSKNIINYYKSLDKLKILTFWQILKDKNILLLDFDYFDGKKYSNKQKHEIEQTWLRLYDEYYILLNDGRSKAKMDKSINELKLREKINQIKNNYDFLVQLTSYRGMLPDNDIAKHEQSTYQRLKTIEPKIKPLLFDGIEANLKNLDRVLKSLVNTYNRNHKENDVLVTKEIQNVYDVVASAESWLERSIPISDMVVSHWIAIQNQIKDKQKAQKNGK